MSKDQVTIVGAGIVGICCALSLIERGIPVRLIDRDKPGQGTSSGNAGVISPWSIIPMALPGIWKKVPGMLLSSDRPLSVKPNFWPKMIPWGMKFLSKSKESEVRNSANAMHLLCGPSVALYKKHLEGTGYESLIVDSFYVHAYKDKNKANIHALDYQIRSEKGADLELITGHEIQDVEPSLSTDYKAAVLIKGQARALTPGMITKVLTEKARSLGVEIISLDVTNINRSEEGWVIQGSDNSIFSKKVIVSAGVWSKKLLEPLGIKLPLVAERGYHMEFANPGLQINNSIMDVESKLVASSMQDGMRLAGAAEFANPDEMPDQTRKELLTNQAKVMFPNLAADHASFWMGCRPSFPDSLPVIGPIDGQKELYAAFGHSHFGLMMAPKTGEILAEYISDDPDKTDISSFSHKRFGHMSSKHSSEII